MQIRSMPTPCRGSLERVVQEDRHASPRKEYQGMASDDYDEKYTDPDLRRKIKDELMQSDKGGKPGQWSARKSQMLAREYEAQGGSYKGE